MPRWLSRRKGEKKSQKPKPTLIIRPTQIVRLVAKAEKQSRQGKRSVPVLDDGKAIVGRDGEIVWTPNESEVHKANARSVNLIGLSAMVGTMWGGEVPEDMKELFSHMYGLKAEGITKAVKTLVPLRLRVHYVKLLDGGSKSADVWGVHHVHALSPTGPPQEGHGTRLVIGDSAKIWPWVTSGGGRRKNVQRSGVKLHQAVISRAGLHVHPGRFIFLDVNEKRFSKILTDAFPSEPIDPTKVENIFKTAR